MTDNDLRSLAATRLGWAEQTMGVLSDAGAPPPPALKFLHELAKAVCEQPVVEPTIDHAELQRALAAEGRAALAERRVVDAEGAYEELLNNLRLVLDRASLKTLAEPGSLRSPGKEQDATADVVAATPPAPVAPAGAVPQASASSSPAPALSVAPVAGAADGSPAGAMVNGAHERKHGIVLQHKAGHSIVLAQDGDRWWSRTVAGGLGGFTIGPLTALLDETIFPQTEWTYLPTMTEKVALPPMGANGHTTSRKTWLQLIAPNGATPEGERYQPFEVELTYEGPKLWTGKRAGAAHTTDFSRVIWREVPPPTSASAATTSGVQPAPTTNGKTRIADWVPDNATLIDCLGKATSQVPAGKRLVDYVDGVPLDRGRELVATWKRAKPSLELADPAGAFVHVAAKLIQGKAL